MSAIAAAGVANTTVQTPKRQAVSSDSVSARWSKATGALRSVVEGYLAGNLQITHLNEGVSREPRVYGRHDRQLARGRSLVYEYAFTPEPGVQPGKFKESWEPQEALRRRLDPANEQKGQFFRPGERQKTTFIVQRITEKDLPFLRPNTVLVDSHGTEYRVGKDPILARESIMESLLHVGFLKPGSLVGPWHEPESRRR